jgi:hypothetical protein
MASPSPIYVAQAEWRWLTIASGALLLVAGLPVVLVMWWAQSSNAYFMGALHGLPDVAADLSRMTQGYYGDWLMLFKHTPEPHAAIIFQPVYAFLGHIANLTGISDMVVFHIARLVASFIMYSAIYQLGAALFSRVRTRRIFFVICALASGLGWLAALQGRTSLPDLSASHVFPFIASLTNFHDPLTIACLAMIVSVLIVVTRPGFDENPSVSNGGVLLAMLVLVLVVMQPAALVPLFTAFASCVIWNSVSARRLAQHEARWLLWLIIPALPVGAYYAVLITRQPFVAGWMQQLIGPYFAPGDVVMSFVLVAALALPGLVRAARQMAADSDRLMVLWLAAMIGWYLLRVPLNTLFITGMMLPLAYFATRTVDHFLLPRVARRHWPRLFLAGAAAALPSLLAAAFVPVALAIYGGPNYSASLMDPDYVAAMNYLSGEVGRHSVVVAAPAVSLWIPYYVDTPVLYGHPDETIDAGARYREMLMWYQSQDEAVCRALRRRQITRFGTYRVAFALYGPRERQYGSGLCVQDLEPAATFGRVSVYQCDERCALDAAVLP